MTPPLLSLVMDPHQKLRRRSDTSFQALETLANQPWSPTAAVRQEVEWQKPHHVDQHLPDVNIRRGEGAPRFLCHRRRMRTGTHLLSVRKGPEPPAAVALDLPSPTVTTATMDLIWYDKGFIVPGSSASCFCAMAAALVLFGISYKNRNGSDLQCSNKIQSMESRVRATCNRPDSKLDDVVRLLDGLLTEYEATPYGPKKWTKLVTFLHQWRCLSLRSFSSGFHGLHSQGEFCK